MFSGKHFHGEWTFLEFFSRLNNVDLLRRNVVRQKERGCMRGTVGRRPKFPANGGHIHQMVEMRMGNQDGPRG